MKAKVLKAFHQFEEGEVYEFRESTFNALEKKGYVEKVKAKRGRPSKKDIKEEE